MRIQPGTYRRAAAAALLLLALAAVSGCGGGGRDLTKASGKTLTIYASLPRHGISGRAADAVAAGERLALDDAHGRVGKRRVRLIELDSSAPAGETWDPSAVEENARRAVADPSTIAYLGELDLGGSAVSVPVTNGLRILQVAPEDGLTSLTQSDPAGGGIAPARYYPSGTRNFLRLVPTDLLQAGVLVSWARAQGAHSLVVVQDESLFGRELGAEVVAAAAGGGVAVTERAEARDDPTAYPGFAASLAQRHPDAVVYTGLGDATAGPLLTALAGALPNAHLYGSSALANAAPEPAGMPPVEVVAPVRPQSQLPASGRRVLARLAAELGPPVDPDAVYGYEAMQIVLDALRAVGRKQNNRADVARAALRPRQRRSVLGDYAIYAAGDTSSRGFAAYRRSDATLTFLGMRYATAPVAATPPAPGG